ncbi:unnamed protein product, partial [Ceratitis capitata]
YNCTMQYGSPFWLKLNPNEGLHLTQQNLGLSPIDLVFHKDEFSDPKNNRIPLLYGKSAEFVCIQGD